MEKVIRHFLLKEIQYRWTMSFIMLVYTSGNLFSPGTALIQWCYILRCYVSCFSCQETYIHYELWPVLASWKYIYIYIVLLCLPHMVITHTYRSAEAHVVMNDLTQTQKERTSTNATGQSRSYQSPSGVSVNEWHIKWKKQKSPHNTEAH